ncbi:MAG: tetratricopeptide repeat protein [Catenulispora sp.]|nr:tetratricopeptide repeat protein [Catenulispora sp.]
MTGEDAVAEELFQAALADGGGFSGSVHSFYAGFLLERGREDEALALIDAARKAKPDHAHVYAVIAETLDVHGHHRQAAAWATRGLVFLFGSLTDIEPADLLEDGDGRLLAADRLRARRHAGLPADHIDEVIAPGVDAHQRPEA